MKVKTRKIFVATLSALCLAATGTAIGVFNPSVTADAAGAPTVTDLGTTYNVNLADGDLKTVSVKLPEDETVTYVSVGGVEVWSGSQAFTANTAGEIALNVSDLDYGKQEMYIEAEDGSAYICVANVATKVLTTVADVQGWLTDIDMNGYYMLGNNITSDDYWDYSAKSINDVSAFTGTFDGNGYYIEKMNLTSDANQQAFLPTNNGTVKDVAFVDCKLTPSVKFNQSGFLTQQNNGTISNVYMDVEMVFGDNGWAYAGLVAKQNDGTVSEIVLKVTGSVQYGEYINYASFVMYENKTGTISDVYLITNINSATDTSQSNNVKNFKHGNCTAKYDTESAMANSGVNFAGIFTSDVWTISEGVPKFASATPVYVELEEEYAMEKSASSISVTLPKAETITSITLGEAQVFSSSQAVSANVATSVTVDLTSVTAGVYAMHIVTASGATYTANAKVATKILTTVADVQGWLTGIDMNGYYMLGNNITSDTVWEYTPGQAVAGGSFDFNNASAGFGGTFDGNGYYIEKMNMTISEGNNQRMAFLPVLAQGGTVKDVAFVDCTYTWNAKFDQCSFLVQTNYGTISNVYVDVDVQGNDNGWEYAGLVAKHSKGTVSNVVLNVTGSVKYGVWVNYASFVMHGNDGTISDVYLITNINSATDTSQSNAVKNFAHGNCTAKYDGETAMASSGVNFAEIFTSDVWTIVDGVPKFASTVELPPVHPEEPEKVTGIAGASLSLSEDIAVRFFVEETKLQGVAQAFLTAEFNDVTYRLNGVANVFTFYNILPTQMKDEIIVTLYTRNAFETEFTVYDAFAYTVADYCYAMVADNGADAKVKTICINLLNYGAAAQDYKNYNKGNLANAELTDEQKEVPALEDLNNAYNLASDCDSDKATWKAGQLVLGNRVAIQLTVAAEDVEGLSVVVRLGGVPVACLTEFEATETDEQYTVLFVPTLMGCADAYTFEVREGDALVSDTLTYSVESYAAAKVNDQIVETVDALVMALMNYVQSVKEYVTASNASYGVAGVYSGNDCY